MTINPSTNQSREIYHNNLKNIVNHCYPGLQIKTAEQLKMYCPHLSDNQVAYLFDNAKLGKIKFFAAPSLLVKNSYHVLKLNGESKQSQQAEKIITLSHAYHQRTLESYADGKPHGDVFFYHKFEKEAMEYANSNWSKSLVLDDWVAASVDYVSDPKDLVKTRYSENVPKRKAAIYWAVSRDWNEINSDDSKKTSEVWNDSLAYFTFDYVEGSELKGGRGGYSPEYFCAHCGESIIPNDIWDRFYKDEKPYECRSKDALPQPIVKALQSEGLLSDVK